MEKETAGQRAKRHLSVLGIHIECLSDREALDLFDRLQKDGVFDAYYSCSKKHKYPTRALATIGAYRQEVIRPRGSYVPYKCRWCDGYHVGRTPKGMNLSEVHSRKEFRNW